MYSLVALLALAASSAVAVQPGAPSPPGGPIRQLPWGELNFLHTTDTHGWHGGHLQEGSYSADWGDYISFAKHLRDKADREGTDLLIIDTGDRVEGNGLYDASKPKGLYTFDIFEQQKIDILTSGNHELYQSNSSNDEYYKLAPAYNESYIASNIDKVNETTGELEPLAPRFRKFTTKNQGIRIMAFGFLFDFDRSSNNTVVKPVEDVVKEQWFRDAISDRNIDLFLVAGHVALRSMEYELIFKTIREQQWDTPIQFFGGHFHIRDWRRYDATSYGLASGRYMETIGFSSIEGLRTNSTSGSSASASPRFRRRYIDNNLYSLHYHSDTNVTTFDTPHGSNVTRQITAARKALKLDDRHGCAPKDLWLDRAELQSNDSIQHWLITEVLPDKFSEGSKAIRPKLVLQNTGAVRFDIFKGPFTRDTTFLISPFTSAFRQIKDVDYAKAAKLLDVLNSGGPILAKQNPELNLSDLKRPEQLAQEAGLLRDIEMNSVEARGQKALTAKPELTPGYTTTDDDGSDGDDTIHSPIAHYKIPQVMQTLLDFPTDGKTPVPSMDVVFDSFIEPWVLGALKFLGSEYNITNVMAIGKGESLTTMIADWVETNWPCEELLDEL